MQEYRVTSQYISFGVGEILKMDEAQHALRSRMLSEVEGEKDTYRVEQGTVYFKKGETFGLEGEMPKAYYSQAVKIVEGKERPMLPNPKGSAPARSGESSAEESDTDDDTPQDYEAMERDDLYQKAKDRGLKPNAKLGKPKLIGLLQENDIATGTPDGDPDNDPPPDYEAMDRDKLWAEAHRRELDPDPELEKPDLIALLELDDETAGDGA